ncbi:MAG: ribosome silencing factor [Candidatus Tectomicrobia bacterium]|uniref:Ribosomal silencing factor RsfS n=1 Tax=Tectimicrobiota bacterium TaxID=2528274 RepID=A0A933GNL8_UNCTE|nr:ribosome silencing factor [Candidatus Tectomicrobia bacterium]
MTLSLEDKATICSQAAIEKKALDPVILDLRGISDVTDFFFICSAGSLPHLQAIAENIQEKLEVQDVFCLGREGFSDAKWILLDYGDLVIHIFHQEQREFYDLERLWGGAPHISLVSNY